MHICILKLNILRSFDALSFYIASFSLFSAGAHLHDNRRILLLRDVVHQLLDLEDHERLQAGLAEAQVPQMAQDEAPLLVPQLS